MAGPTENDRMIRVDMTNQTATIEPFPKKWDLLGGRALSARILTEECDATCDPLGPDNILVLAPGVISGTAAPTSGRLSVGGKSPLTGGIKEANVGGNPGQDLMKLGFRVIIVKGQPSDADKRYAVDITEEGVTVIPADEHKGKWNYKLIEDLVQTYSKKASFISIGPAGEMRLSGSSVACTDADKARHPARHAGRGGLGAVMGSKGLKYVSVDAGRKTVRKAVQAKDFMAMSKKYTKEFIAGPGQEPFPKWGTSVIVEEANSIYTFPHKNRTEGRSPDVHTLDGMRIVESFEERGGEMHNCMTGCIVKCSNIVMDAEGNYKTSALEFETLTLMGSNCGIASWEDVADLDRLCDEIGLDTIETGAAIAIYMDSGDMQFGDAAGAKRLMQEIADGTDLGKAIGNGAVAIGKRQKHDRVGHVKGQALPAWDPRPLKAAGVTYCTSPMGADHTAGLVVDPGQPLEDIAQASQEAQILNTAIDASGFCQFLGTSIEELGEFYTLFFGETVSREQIADIAWQCMLEEWAFNKKAGLDESDDEMCDSMKTDPIGPTKMVWDVPMEIVRQAYERFDPREELFTTKPS